MFRNGTLLLKDVKRRQTFAIREHSPYNRINTKQTMCRCYHSPCGFSTLFYEHEGSIAQKKTLLVNSEFTTGRNFLKSNTFLSSTLFLRPCYMLQVFSQNFSRRKNREKSYVFYKILLFLFL